MSSAPQWQSRDRRVVHDHMQTVTEYDIQAPGGRQFCFPVLHTRCDGAMVVPVTDHGTVIVARQHRFALDRRTTEMPSGGIDSGESPLAAALRELREEVGFEASEVVAVGVFPEMPQHSDHETHIFIATGCRIVAAIDGDEDARPQELSFQDALARCGGGDVPAMSALALLLAARRLGF